MATTRSQAARDAAPETTTERESVASETRTDKLMALLQQIVANQIKEKRARENYQEKRQERERERQKRERERFEVWKETVGEKLVQFSRRIDEVKEENDGGQQQEGNEEREEEGGEMRHEKEGAEETDHLQEERERAEQEQKSHQEAESPKGAEPQKEEERQERRICLSTKTHAQRQVLEEMIPPREGQRADITCDITVAVDAWLKGGSDVAVDSRNTCGFVVDASLKGGGGNTALCR